ncbi:hypothetical protein PtB15_10B188 [Puccinia triticina]|nr:hypothetical protein PtB15_10B188 [Puccinia triticina]
MNHRHPQQSHGIVSFPRPLPAQVNSHDSQCAHLPLQMGFNLHNRDPFPVEHHPHELSNNRHRTSLMPSAYHHHHASNQTGPPAHARKPLPPYSGYGLAPILSSRSHHRQLLPQREIHPLPLRPNSSQPIPSSNTQPIDWMNLNSTQAGVIRNSCPSLLDHSGWPSSPYLAARVAPAQLPVTQGTVSTPPFPAFGSAELSHSTQNHRQHQQHLSQQATHQLIAPLPIQIQHRSSSVQDYPLALICPKGTNTNLAPLRIPTTSLDLSLPGTIPSGCGSYHPQDPILKRSANTVNGDELQQPDWNVAPEPQ